MAQTENHICFFNSHIEWGGGEKWHSEAAFELYKKKHPVVLIAHRHGRLIKKMQYCMPVMSVVLSNLSFLNLYKYIQLYRIFKQYNVKTLILCLPIDVKVAGVAAKFAGVKNIVYRRGSAIPVKNSVYNRFLFSKVITQIIANSEATAKTLLQNNSNLIDRNKITVIYNGIEIPALKKKKENSKLIIAAAGRLEYQKNFEFLISVVDVLRNKGFDFEIQIAGKGELRQELELKIQEYRLKKYVKLVGFQSDLSSFLRNSDIFVLPSHWEGFGFVLAEAMAQELPLIAFNVSSNPELITHNFNGILIPKDDLDAFVDSVIHLLNNADERKRLGENGRTLVSQKFSAESIHAQIESYILQLHSN